MAQDSELLFDYGDRYWGEGEPVEATGSSADAAPPKRRRASSTVCRPDEAAWQEKLAQLAAYKAEHGDCNVPCAWAKDPPLGRWVHKQRHRKKKLDRGEPWPGMTAARVGKLEALRLENVGRGDQQAAQRRKPG